MAIGNATNVRRNSIPLENFGYTRRIFTRTDALDSLVTNYVPWDGWLKAPGEGLALALYYGSAFIISWA